MRPSARSSSGSTEPDRTKKRDTRERYPGRVAFPVRSLAWPDGALTRSLRQNRREATSAAVPTAVVFAWAIGPRATYGFVGLAAIDAALSHCRGDSSRAAFD